MKRTGRLLCAVLGMFFLAGCNLLPDFSITLTPVCEDEMVWDFVSELKDSSVLLMSKSGYALFSYMAIGSGRGVSIVTNNTRISDVAKLFSGKITVINANLDDTVPIETIWEVVRNNKTDLFCDFDQLVAIYVSKYVNGARANSMTVFHKSDFLT